MIKQYILLLALFLSLEQTYVFASPKGNKSSDIPINYSYNTACGNYYLQSLQMKKYKWNKFPVTVNINGVPDKYKLTAIRAINKWGEYIPLKISKSANSNILIIWVKKLPVLGRGFVGEADHLYKNEVHTCRIAILYKNHYSLSEIQEILVHELGHALGLDHSHNSKDIMFNTIKPCKKALPPKSLITPRDLNTLYLIYSEKQ